MAKRSPLSFDNEELTKNLKESAGKGLNAFFSPTPPLQNIEQKTKLKKEAQPQIEIKQESKKANTIDGNKTIKKENNMTSNIASKLASNIAILQFTDDEVDELKESAFKAQTFRFTDREIEWLKDTSYRLSKEIKRGKVSQVDIIRISFKLFEALLASNKADLLKILERIK